MHIFVTGGAGYIGSICSEELLNAGHEVTIFDNLTEGHRLAVDPRATFIEGDLAKRDEIMTAVAGARPAAIMHFAANALVPESMTNPSKYFRNNVAAGINLLDAAVEAGVKKFIFSSTCATYGTPEKVPIDEKLPQKPINPYGLSKLMFEQVLGWYDKIHGLTHVNLRYFNAAGASEKYGEDHRIETHLIPNIIKVALGQRETAEIFGDKYATPDGTCIRDYIHILDLAAAHMLALNARRAKATTSAAARAFPCGRSSTSCRRSRACRSRSRSPRRARAIRPGWSPARTRSSRSSAGGRSSRACSPSSKARGPGTRSTRMGMATEPPAHELKTVACLGASLTAGSVSADYVEMLAARPALAGYRFLNHGVNGDVAWRGLQRLDKVIADQPDAVTILIGTNDVNATLSERNLRHYLEFYKIPTTPTREWYEENLRAIVGRLQAGDARAAGAAFAGGDRRGPRARGQPAHRAL